MIFNNILYSASYPLAWSKAKLVTIFKKGDRKDVRNHRGISIINSIAKVYDMVLCSRLRQWFRPFREQAGAQEKRGCLENTVALRLLCDMAKRKKLKLFVTFIDFPQAYDRIPSHKLFYICVTTVRVWLSDVMCIDCYVECDRELGRYGFSFNNTWRETGSSHLLFTFHYLGR